MKGHKAHHHMHGGKAHHYGHEVHHKHPRAAHAKGGHVMHHDVESDMEGHFADDASPQEVYAGKGSHVEMEAKKRKRGGMAKHHVGMAMGKMAHHRGDRKPRKAGGRASDMNPLSSANPGKEPKAHHSYEPEHD